MGALIPVETFEDPLQAELAKNCLEAGGVAAMVSAGEAGKVNLVVDEADAGRARELLGGQDVDEAEVSAEDREQIQNEEADAKRADEEFRVMELEGLRQKAASARSNGILGGVSLVLSVVFFVLSLRQGWWFRLGLACLVLAVIQFFVWKDAVKAKKELEAAPAGESEDL